MTGTRFASTRAGVIALDLAVPHVDDPSGVRGHVGVVRHDDDRQAGRVELLEHPQDFFAGARVEVSGRLVSQEHNCWQSDEKDNGRQ